MILFGKSDKRSACGRVSPKSDDKCLHKSRERQTEDYARTGVMLSQAKGHQVLLAATQKLKTDMGQLLPVAAWNELTRLTLRYGTSSLQNIEQVFLLS